MPFKDETAQLFDGLSRKALPEQHVTEPFAQVFDRLPVMKNFIRRGLEFPLMFRHLRPHTPEIGMPDELVFPRSQTVVGLFQGAGKADP